MFERGVVIGALALALAPLGASAQDWREVTSFRQRAEESRLDVHVHYGAGKLSVRPGEGGELYRVGLRYDSDLFDPVTEYRDGALDVGVEGTGRGIRLKNHEAGEMKLSLSPAVPLALDMEFGAVEATLDLGGLRITTMEVQTGASDTKIHFSRPNPERCERLEISMGAAALEAVGLANANCSRVTVEGGVGDAKLEFTGDWRQDMEADITMALGSATLVIPEDVGVSVDKQTFLSDFDRSGFEKRGSVYYSKNWDSATHHLTIDLEGAFGSVTVRWARPTGAGAP